MKIKLSSRELVFISSMLFGLFFGAGNLIFPIYMGQLAGSNVWKALAGFLITGVGLPLLGVTAIGISRSEGLSELSGKVGKPYGIFFTLALYLTIGPFFAIPRCVTVSFAVGIEPMLASESDIRILLLIFSLLFFIAVLGLSLSPGKILTWIGKILNPLFLLFLGILLVSAFVNPMGAAESALPKGSYALKPFFTGFLEGYNTMDALAGLAFGIVVIDVIRGLGITEPEAVAKNTVKAGISSSIIMAMIYIAVALVGAQSRGSLDISSNGGEAFALLADHYFGQAGAVILAVTVTFACLKTAVGLVTGCSETFCKLFPKALPYKLWTAIFSMISFLIANTGLEAIISFSLPVLMFLYPLAITLILLGLFGNLFGHSKYVYRFVTGFTAIAALLDFLMALPTKFHFHISCWLNKIYGFVPFSDLGLGWILPAFIGLFTGIAVMKIKEKKGYN